tara:strand:- start:2641 stop:4014 length:1374 start_codon:yes stop_codon:yes gene_type:complete
MTINTAYFIGIGGAGMSALARYYKHVGFEVKGYDRTATPLTDALISEGIEINFDDDIYSIPSSIVEAEKLLLVITPAIPDSNHQLQELIKKGHVPRKRAEILGVIISGGNSIAIAGTHGKTSITALLAHIMDGSQKGCNAFLGGISACNNSNIYHRDTAEWTVVEADEFDKSFLHLHPTYGLITSLDPDHLDIYGDEESFIKAFEEFSTQIKNLPLIAKNVVWNYGEYERYGIKTSEGEAVKLNHYASNIKAIGTGIKCDLSLDNEGGIIDDVTFPMLGKHNVENMVGASALAYHAGISLSVIKSRLTSFSGIYRRFQVLVNTQKKVYIDDYAHHPTEIKLAINAVREHFPGRHLTLIFQPHLYSRTIDQLSGLCRELEKADRLILLPIYAAREKEIEGVNTQLILNNISHPHAELSTKNSIFENLKAHSVDILLTAGAGDIDTLVPELQKMISSDA